MDELYHVRVNISIEAPYNTGGGALENLGGTRDPWRHLHGARLDSG